MKRLELALAVTSGARLALSALLLAVVSECATLTGRVLDESGQPIRNAEVRTADRAQRTTTDAAGRFQLNGLPEANVDVEVLAAGRQGGARRAFDLSRTPIQEVEFVLPKIPEQSEMVVVTGSGARELLIEAPVRTELISRETLKAQAARSLTESLTATVPGVRIENNCQNCGFSAVRLNGLEGPYTQILEDGLPSVSGASLVYGLEQLPTEFFENIEVVKGGASTLYGPNAVGGVINLVRREPSAKFFEIDTQVGWNGGRPQQTVGVIAQADNLFRNWAADAYFRGFRRTHLDIDRDGFTELTRRNSQAGGGTLFRRFADGRARLTMGGSSLREFRRGGSQLDLLPEKTFITEQIDSDREAGFARWNHAPSPTFYYNLSTSLAHFGRASYYGADFDPNAYGNTKNWLSVSDASLGKQAGRHAVATGFQYWYEKLLDTFPGYGRRINQSFTNAGFYAQDEWRPTRRLTLLGGVRADKSNLLGNVVWSPRGNVRYALSDKLSLRAGLSTGFRAPQVFDEDLHIASAGGEVLIVQRAQNLRQESSRSFTAALDYNGALGGRPFFLGSSFFWTQLNDAFQLAELPGLDENRIFERINGPGSRFRGVEMSTSLSLSKAARFRSGWTFQQARYQEAEPLFGSLRYLRTPNQYGYAGVDLDLPRGWTLSQTFDFTGPMQVPHFAGFIEEDRLERSPWFGVWNLVLGKTFAVGDKTKLHFYTRANNVTQSYQREFDQGPLRDSKYVYGPILPRGVITGFSVAF